MRMHVSVALMPYAVYILRWNGAESGTQGLGHPGFSVATSCAAIAVVSQLVAAGRVEVLT